MEEVFEVNAEDSSRTDEPGAKRYQTAPSGRAPLRGTAPPASGSAGAAATKPGAGVPSPLAKTPRENTDSGTVAASGALSTSTTGTTRCPLSRCTPVMVQHAYSLLGVTEADEPLPDLPPFSVLEHLPKQCARYFEFMSRVHGPIEELEGASRLSYAVQLITDVYFSTSLPFVTDYSQEVFDTLVQPNFLVLSSVPGSYLLGLDCVNSGDLHSNQVVTKLKAAVVARSIPAEVKLPVLYYIATDLVRWDLYSVRHRTQVVSHGTLMTSRFPEPDSIIRVLSQLCRLCAAANTQQRQANNLPLDVPLGPPFGPVAFPWATTSGASSASAAAVAAAAGGGGGGAVSAASESRVVGSGGGNSDGDGRVGSDHETGQPRGAKRLRDSAESAMAAPSGPATASAGAQPPVKATAAAEAERRSPPGFVSQEMP